MTAHPGGLRVQNLLLGVGTGLLAVAAVVFTAVTWDRLDAAFQAAILFGATGILVAVTSAAARHRMPATAEALGLVTVLLALVDAHAVRVGGLPAVDATAFWAVALAVVAGAAWALALATGIHGTRLVAVVLGQVPLLLALLAAGATSTVTELALLAQVAVVVELAHGARGSRPEPRALAAAIAALCWASVIVVVAVEVAFSDWLGTSRSGTAGVLAVAGAIAAQVSWRRAGDEAIRVLGLLAASVLGIAAAAAGVAEVIEGAWWAPVVGLVAVAAVAGGTRAPARWGRIPATVAAGAAGLASLPLVEAVAGSIDTAMRVTGSAWELSAGSPAAAFAGPSTQVVSPGPLAAHLGVVVALVLAAGPLLGRRWVAAGVAGASAAAVVVSPFLLSLDLAEATLVTGGAAVLAAGAGLVHGRRPAVRWTAAVSALGLGGLVAAWGSATPGLSVVAVTLIAATAIVLAVCGWEQDDEALALPAAATALLAAAAAVGLAVATGQPNVAGFVAGGIAAVAFGLVGGLLFDPVGRASRAIDRHLAWTVEAAGWLVHVVALFWTVSAEDVRATAVLLGSGAIAAGLHAARPWRRELAGLAVGEGLLFVWLQLGDAGVRTAEAYTLPLAVALLAVGVVVARRGEPLGSWVTLGPALVVGLAPTVVLAFGDPGLVRPLAGLVAGAVVLAAGAVTGRRAPVDVGTAAVVVLGLRQLVPIVGELPNWAVLGATGAFLLALGATFEQRRRDLHDARHRYAALR